MKRLGMILCLILSGCGGDGSDPGSAPAPNSTTKPTSTVNLVVTDTPSTRITVLSFQVQITGAVLEPGSVSILPRPVTVDLAQLVSDTGLLASSVIDSETYTSLDLTFANPQVTIVNNTGAALALAGQSCDAGATCTFVPTVNTASLVISNGVFPITLTANASTGLNLDLSIPDLLQSDLSVTFANGSSVNLSLLPGETAAAQQAQIDDVLASITKISGDQVSVTTAFGDSLVLNTNAATLFNYPGAICPTAGESCLAVGQVVALDLALLGSGALTIDTVSYVGASGTEWVRALVLSTDLSGTAPSAQVLVRRSLNVDTLSTGQIATVSLPPTTAFAIGAAGFPAIATSRFSSAVDLIQGQELMLNVGADYVSGSAPTFSAGGVYLESSQVIGEINSIDIANGSFAVTAPLLQLMDVQTATSASGGATAFVGLTSLSSLAVGQLIVAKGPLFATTSSSFPDLAAVQVSARP